MQSTTVWLSLSGVVIILALGCASTGGDRDEPRPRDGIAEYRQVTLEAQKAMDSALRSLAAVSAQSNRCAPNVLSAFSAEIERLQVDSIRVRARAQAMQARGDAYFARWQEHLARVKDPEVQAIAESRRPQYEEGFAKIKRLSQQTREAFTPFASGLRKVRNALEADPASLDAGTTRDQIAAAKQDGAQVEKCLAAIVRELDSLRALLPPQREPAGQKGTR